MDKDLVALLRRAPLLRELSDEELGGLLPAMANKRVAAGKTLFKQGQPGDSLVIVLKGRFDVTAVDERIAKTGRVAGARKVGEILPGDVVGEMACLDPAPRSATVTATVDAEVAELNRMMLDSLKAYAPLMSSKIVGGVARRASQRIRETNGKIDLELPAAVAKPRRAMSAEGAPVSTAAPRKRARILHPGQVDFSALAQKRGLSSMDVEVLASQAILRELDDGDILCAEGDAGDCCYFIAKGEVQICRAVDGVERVFAVLGTGQVVGQMALLDNLPRSATVRAGGQTIVVELSRAVFENLTRAGSALAVRFQEEIAVAAIRQLRLATARLAALPEPLPETRDKKAVRRQRATDILAEKKRRLQASYVKIAINELDIILAELDDITIVKADGVMTQAELRMRRG